MKAFSRNLPKGGSYPDMRWLDKAVGFVLLGGVGYLVLRSFQEWGSDAALGYLVAVFVLLFVLWPSHYFAERKLNALIADRPDDSICTFARSFDRRKVDPWVIRAVYNDLQNIMHRAEGPFPIRASDNLWTDLLIDEDDLDLDMAENLPQLIGRCNKNMKDNPHYGRVHTVEDLVLFFNALPLNTSSELHKNAV